MGKEGERREQRTREGSGHVKDISRGTEKIDIKKERSVVSDGHCTVVMLPPTE
jgi:hypothetical protein